MERLLKFQTISDFVEYKLKEKGSLFISHAYPVQTETEAVKILDSTKKKYFDATHHCFAFQINQDNVNYSDDGEPSGTAGVRILNAIQHFKLRNIIVIVTRYFGGIKLGVGPLGKAYYNAAFSTLGMAAKIYKEAYTKLKIKFNYDQISRVHRLLSKYKAKILDNQFEEKSAITFLLKNDSVEKFISEVSDNTRGKCEIAKLEETIFI